jgi:hypothetical protein
VIGKNIAIFVPILETRLNEMNYPQRGVFMIEFGVIAM